MPTYEYRCKTCGTEFETLQSMSAEPLKNCLIEVCPLEETKKGTGEVERRISAGSGLMFRGTGFYITDYKGGTGGTSEKSDKSAKSEKSTKSDSSDKSGTSDTPSTPKVTTPPSH